METGVLRFMGSAVGRACGAAIVLASIIGAPATAGAATTISENLTGNHVWTATGSPYTLSRSVTVAAGGSLTIRPGTRVQSVDGARLNLVGRLEAVGTAADPITLSVRDGLRFYHGSLGSEVAWATVRDSTGFGITTDLDGQDRYGPWPDIHDVELRSNRWGVYAWYPAGGTASIRSARFIGNTYGLDGGGGTLRASRILVAEGLGASATFWNNHATDSWTITESNLLPPAGRACCSLAAGAGGTVSAEGVWWGTTSPPEIEDRISHNTDDPGNPVVVDYEPFATAPHDLYPPASAPAAPAGGYLKADARSMTGTASDAGAATSGVVEVTVSLRDLTTGKYWDGAGWISSERFRLATGTTAWSIAVPTLTDGHRYRVRSLATDRAGNVQWGAAPATFTADAALPTVVAPSATLVAGSTLGAASIPVRLDWSGADNLTAPGRLRFDVEARAYRDGAWGPWTAVASALTTLRTKTYSLDADVAYQFRARAHDLAGHASGYRTGPTVRARAMQETIYAPTLAYTGAWTPVRDAWASGGAVRSTTTAGSDARLTFTGRSVAVVMPRRATLGLARVCLDPGTALETCENVDLAAGALGSRKVVFARNGLDGTTHVLTVTAVSGRIDLDALPVLK